jgi:NADH-quinone oxidoreductase subunit H
MEAFILFVKVFIMFNLIMGLSYFCTWFERKGSALIQNRIGANRAGAFFQTKLVPLKPAFFLVRWLGILGVINTLVCDAVKALLKEDFVPEGTSVFMHAIGPFLAVLPVFVAFATVPLAPAFTLGGYHIVPQVASLDAGLLFILAMGSLSVYGVAMAGWTGNNKFSLLGGLRAAAQMISYELAMGLCFVSAVIVFQTLEPYKIVESQAGSLLNWGIFSQPLGFFIFFIVGMAETKRGPFDLPESESELVAGYFTEYSGMKFLIFWLGEFAEIGLFALLLTILFLGGWQLPFLNRLPEGVWWVSLIGHGVLMGKVVVLSMLQIVIRWTLPRFRFDQLMSLGWKVLLPLSMANLMVTAAIKLAFHVPQ